MHKCKKNIAKIFESARKKLDAVEPPEDLGGRIYTPYGVVTFFAGKATGSKKSMQWIVDSVLKPWYGSSRPSYLKPCPKKKKKETKNNS